MHKQQILKNGIQLITAPISGTKTVTVLVMVGTGSKYEDKKMSGISHFVEHMLFQGTKRRPTSFALTAELDGIGAEFNAFTGKEYTGYYIKAEAGNVKKIMDIVSDMLVNSRLAAKNIVSEKGVITEELNMYLDNPIMYLEDVFEECFYGDTPAGRDTIGTRETIASFTRADFVNYVDSQYGPQNLVVCLAGRLPDDPAALVRQYFNTPALVKRGRKFREKETAKDSQQAPKIKVNFKKTDQAHISLGVRGFAYGHPDKTAAKLMSVLLGGSMSSRLFINLRDKHGLAYYVATESENYTDTGYVTTRAGVPIDKISDAIRIILGEYNKLKTEPVPAAELRKVKDLYRGRVALQLEASQNLANWYGRQAILAKTLARSGAKGDALSISAPDNFIKELEKVTAADIRRVAREIFTDEKLNLAVIGPYEKKEKFLQILKLA